jgi:hypothetical protein
MIEEDIPDIVETLRECAEDSRKVEGDYYADQFATDASVFDDAADAIEKLRDEIARLRLTDAERKAVEWAVAAASNFDHPADDTLRGLLERLK